MDYRLKSGRVVYANGGIFGLSEDLELTEGYDGSLSSRWPGYEYEPDPEHEFTADEVREIADIMIERWTRFRAALPISPPEE